MGYDPGLAERRRVGQRVISAFAHFPPSVVGEADKSCMAVIAFPNMAVPTLNASFRRGSKRDALVVARVAQQSAHLGLIVQFALPDGDIAV